MVLYTGNKILCKLTLLPIISCGCSIANLFCSIKYLGIPDTAEGVGDLLFKSASFLGSFPFLHSMAPAPLTLENIIKVIALCQGKYKGLLRPDYDVVKLIFLSFADVENEVKESRKNEGNGPQENIDDEDDLVVFSLLDVDAWDEFEAVQKFDNIQTANCYIAGLNMLRLLSFLLSISKLKSPAQLAEFSSYFEPNNYAKFKRSALNLIRAIDRSVVSENDLKNIKITFTQFKPIYDTLFPYVFQPLGELYGLLLFSNTLNQRRPSVNQENKIEGLLSEEVQTKLVNPTTLAQMAALFGHDRIYGRLKKLYVGSDAGFSMRSFESKVFKWNAPTYMLVSGRILNSQHQVHAATGREKSFDEQIPRMTKLTSKQPGNTVTFGLYLTAPWKASSKVCFGNHESLLFQLEPVQDKFVSSAGVLANYAYFSRIHPGGIGAGSAPPQSNPHANSGHGPKSSPYSLGNVSLTLDESLEFGVFRHLGLGGTYRPSVGRGEEEWEDRFEITEVEVWGSGKDEDLEDQKKRWEWEEREASYRARVNVQSLNEDRALLELAGLVGNHGSGGSM